MSLLDLLEEYDLAILALVLLGLFGYIGHSLYIVFQIAEKAMSHHLL